jgi:hypothetical protein
MPENRREQKLVEQGSPCDVNFFNRELLHIWQLGERDVCPNYDTCVKQGKDNYCALR